MNELASPISRRRTRAPRARWLALFLFLAGIALPDCCLNGSHAFGSGMQTFGAICRAKA
jgi:hypothetical protein